MLEADLQTRSRRRREAFQGLRGRSRPAAFQTRNHRLGRLHALGKLLLREAGRYARVNHGASKLELRRQGFIRLPVFHALHPLLVKVSYLGHGSNSFARFRANSISRFGVFCVFLMKTRTTTTRRPTAVT